MSTPFSNWNGRVRQVGLFRKRLEIQLYYPPDPSVPEPMRHSRTVWVGISVELLSELMTGYLKETHDTLLECLALADPNHRLLKKDDHE